MAATDNIGGTPVRSEIDGLDQRVHVKIVGNAAGTGTATQQMAVDTNQNAQVKVHGTGPDAADHTLQTSETGEIRLNGVYNASTNTKPSTANSLAHTRAAAPADAQAGLRVTAIQNVSAQSICMDVSMHDETGAPYTPANPFPVSIEDSKGTLVNSYTESDGGGTGIASGASVNVDLSVIAGKTLNVHQIIAGGADRIKVEAQFSTDGTTFTSFFVGFTTAACPVLSVPFTFPPQVVGSATTKCRLILTNKGLQAESIYSNVIGDLQ